MKVSLKHIIRQASIMLALLFITSCGFQLRGSYALPASLQNICLEQGEYKLLGDELERRLVRSRVNLVDANCASLKLIDAKLDRDVLSLFPNAQVAEYELIYSVTYSLQMPEQQMRLFNVQTVRDYQDDPDAVLAKSKEMKLLLAELRRYAAEQILLQLASMENR
ncbi:Rare lipoprotein B [Catenovulum agarivorans DS-2]|uniref:LPS-assembly lipoprotein LptE n=1 Tax=Catenovulum agarivorans DS-2 TaxID=1328313 RepID=W7QSK3_9ALTE|nr:LPS assembly lipoprotein LptE [Catenovulum agarivorans]EWH08360.1 Rare lipoprotein B [Catenovulum agarivorans DS-2]